LAKKATELTPQQIYDYTMFELAIRNFDTQSGWRDVFERQREYTRRDIFMGKLNPEKFSQRLQETNKYLDFIQMEKSTGKEKITLVMAYGKSLPDDEIISVLGRAIPPECTVNLLVLGKEPWKFKDVDEQLANYGQQWLSDQQK
jgi:hypothetical protein